MKNLTALESQVLRQMVINETGDMNLAKNFISTARVINRTFSPDALNAKRCTGFFTTMNESEFFDLMIMPPRLSLTATHPDLSVGADFILFKHSVEGPFLECSFYGDSLPIDTLLGDFHGFTLSF